MKFLREQCSFMHEVWHTSHSNTHTHTHRIIKLLINYSKQTKIFHFWRWNMRNFHFGCHLLPLCWEKKSGPTANSPNGLVNGMKHELTNKQNGVINKLAENQNWIRCALNRKIQLFFSRSFVPTFHFHNQLKCFKVLQSTKMATSSDKHLSWTTQTPFPRERSCFRRSERKILKPRIFLHFYFSAHTVSACMEIKRTYLFFSMA